MARKLGDNQQAIMLAMGSDHRTHRGSWYPGCGWIWNNQSSTIRLLDSLISHGLVMREAERPRRWLLTRAGWQWIIDLAETDLKEARPGSAYHQALTERLAYLRDQMALADNVIPLRFCPHDGTQLNWVEDMYHCPNCRDEWHEDHFSDEGTEQDA